MGQGDKGTRGQGNKETRKIILSPPLPHLPHPPILSHSPTPPLPHSSPPHSPLPTPYSLDNC
ncbi:hypothetical protein [Tolypothrix sp. VBCCA 56010]|uniref:hypothetical protein n=1 Tax=Tolypothrix sp. VBCCA 56010 TaxID=3137731 RepID=UPI003D7E3D2D